MKLAASVFPSEYNLVIFKSLINRYLLGERARLHCCFSLGKLKSNGNTFKIFCYAISLDFDYSNVPGSVMSSWQRRVPPLERSAVSPSPLTLWTSVRHAPSVSLRRLRTTRSPYSKDHLSSSSALSRQVVCLKFHNSCPVHLSYFSLT